MTLDADVNQLNGREVCGRLLRKQRKLLLGWEMNAGRRCEGLGFIVDGV